MKIRIKVLLGYLLMAALVVVVGVVGYGATHMVGRNFDHAINRTQPVLEALEEIRFHAMHVHLDSYRAAYGVAEAEREVRAGFAKLHAAAARYRTLVQEHFPEETDLAAGIAARLAEVSAWVETPLGAAQARHDIGVLSQAVARLLEAAEQAARQERAEFAEQQDGVAAYTALHEFIILGVGLAAVLSALLGGARLSERVARPVIALRDAARALGRGRLEVRVAAEDSTEVGELAEAFNTMAGQLSRSMVSRDYVEDIIDSLAEGLVVVGIDGRVQRVNRAFRTLFDGGDCSFTGHLLAEYLPDLEIAEGAISGQAAPRWTESRMCLADGEVRTVALSVAGLHSNNAIAGAVVLVQDITARKRNEERLTYLARFDAMTGLPNRAQLLDHLGQSLSRLPWRRKHAAILFCDLDRFKFINDSLGHDVGDVLLQRVAERLQGCIRPGDMVARWSGDEFVVLLDDLARPEDVEPLAERLVDQFNRPVQIGPHELYVTVSVGVSLAPEHSLQPDDLVKCADMAMYAAKSEGKNTYRFYTPGMVERSQERLQLEGALRRALHDGGQLQVHYQAQQRLDGPLIGFEALVRWHHPELGLISPASFLPAAEEAGLMAAIDETVLRIACAQARQWRREGITGLRIAVNVSNHLFRRGDLCSLMQGLLAEFALPPSAIELELTEAIVMSDIESSIRTMASIRALGIELSIDDFGTGYSSLSHLKRCPIQMLKIDRSFVKDVISDPNDAAITEAIAALAHKMGIDVIAEGVETKEQLEALRRYGCDAIQGYWLSKPIPAGMLPDFLVRVGHPGGGDELPERAALRAAG